MLSDQDSGGDKVVDKAEENKFYILDFDLCCSRLFVEVRI